MDSHDIPAFRLLYNVSFQLSASIFPAYLFPYQPSVPEEHISLSGGITCDGENIPRQKDQKCKPDPSYAETLLLSLQSSVGIQE